MCTAAAIFLSNQQQNSATKPLSPEHYQQTAAEKDHESFGGQCQGERGKTSEWENPQLDLLQMALDLARAILLREAG